MDEEKDEQSKDLTDKEREKKLGQIDGKLTPEFLIRKHKINLYKKIGMGDLGHGPR